VNALASARQLAPHTLPKGKLRQANEQMLRHQHSVHDVDDTVGLQDVCNRDARVMSLAVGDKQRLAARSSHNRQRFALNSLELCLPASLPRHHHEVAGRITRAMAECG
jgi:hypothetical protein